MTIPGVQKPHLNLSALLVHQTTVNLLRPVELPQPFLKRMGMIHIPEPFNGDDMFSGHCGCQMRSHPWNQHTYLQ